MKLSLLGLLVLIPVLVAMVISPAIAAEPFSVDLAIDATNSIGEMEIEVPIQINQLNVWGALPATYTATVARVHGSYTQTLATMKAVTGTVSSNISAETWLVPGDVIRVTGWTNATVEINGNQ